MNNTDDNDLLDSTEDASDAELAAEEVTENITTLSTEELDLLLAKVAKKIPMGMAQELKSMSKEDLKARTTRTQLNILETTLAQERDEALADAKEVVSRLAGPYKDAMSVQKAIAKYCALRLQYE